MLIIKITLQHIDFLQFFFLISIDSLQSDENFSNRQTILILLNNVPKIEILLLRVSL